MSETLVNGIKISYSVYGQGTPLVLIGGFNSARNMWYRQIPLFKKYFRTVAFDNRGSGNSERLAGLYSIEVMAHDTLALMDYLEIPKAHLLGDSMGALIAQEIAINYPARVDRLILGASFAKIDDETGPTPAMRRLISLPLREMLDSMADLTLNLAINRTLFLPLAYLKNRGADLNSISEKLKACMAYNCEERLGETKSRTLVICGTDDRLVLPKSSEAIAQKIPQARLVKIEGGSHLLFIEKSGPFNRAVLEFLKEA